jgi:hypothetical protein
MSEQTKAAVELSIAQARNLKTSWKSIDEVRAEEGLDPLADGEGSVVLGIEKVQQAVQQGPGSVQAGINAFSASPGADETLWNRFVSWLRGGKNVEDSKSSSG